MATAQRTGPIEGNPFDDVDDLRLLLLRQAGVIGRRQARRLLTRTAIDHRLAHGDWSLAHRGVYVVGAGEALRVEQRRWVALLAARAGRPAWLGGLSALEALGLDGFHPPAVHVLIPASCRDHDPPAFAVVHRSTALGTGEMSAGSAPPCTAAGRSVVDAAQWSGSDAMAAAVVAAGFQQRLVTLAEIEAAVARQPRARRRRLVLDVARDAAGGPHSLPAAEFVRLCHRAGLPRPRCQVSRFDTNERRRYLDAYFDGYGVHVEIDGAQHVDGPVRRVDPRRQSGPCGGPRACGAEDPCDADDQVLRFPSWLVRHRPGEVAGRVRAVLAMAAWAPPDHGWPTSEHGWLAAS